MLLPSLGKFGGGSEALPLLRKVFVTRLLEEKALKQETKKTADCHAVAIQSCRHSAGASEGSGRNTATWLWCL